MEKTEWEDTPLNDDSMFLDDRLFKICEDFEIKTPDDVQDLNQIIMENCTDYYKFKLTPNLTNKEIKTILDKTFNLFDSFVRLLKKSSNPKMNILHQLFEEYTFKNQFLRDPKISEIYKNL